MKLNEVFYTIQGEGKHAGRAALFLRLPFCNLSCPWCDTEFDSFDEYSEEALQKIIDECPGKFAVITGGEPSMNKDAPALIALLKKNGFEIAMESNGQFPAPAGVDHLTISPKRWTTKSGAPGEKEPFWFDPKNEPSEIKLVLDKETPSEVPDAIYEKWKEGKFKFKENQNPLFFLSPEWGAKGEVLPKVVKYVQENPQWKVSLQTHKIMQVR